MSGEVWKHLCGFHIIEGITLIVNLLWYFICLWCVRNTWRLLSYEDSDQPSFDIVMEILFDLILVALVKRKIVQGYSKLGRFYGRPSMSPFLAIRFSLVIDTLPKSWWISWKMLFWKCTDSWDNNIPISVRVYLEHFYLNIVKIFEAGRVISKNYLEGQQSHTFQEVQM